MKVDRCAYRWVTRTSEDVTILNKMNDVLIKTNGLSPVIGVWWFHMVFLLHLLHHNNAAQYCHSPMNQHLPASSLCLGSTSLWHHFNQFCPLGKESWVYSVRWNLLNVSGRTVMDRANMIPYSTWKIIMYLHTKYLNLTICNIALSWIHPLVLNNMSPTLLPSLDIRQMYICACMSVYVFAYV